MCIIQRTVVFVLADIVLTKTSAVLTNGAQSVAISSITRRATAFAESIMRLSQFVAGDVRNMRLIWSCVIQSIGSFVRQGIS